MLRTWLATLIILSPATSAVAQTEAAPTEAAPAAAPRPVAPAAQDEPKQDEPKSEEPKSEEPKSEEPKSEEPKAEAPPAEVAPATGTAESAPAPATEAAGTTETTTETSAGASGDTEAETQPQEAPVEEIEGTPVPEPTAQPEAPAPKPTAKASSSIVEGFDVDLGGYITTQASTYSSGRFFALFRTARPDDTRPNANVGRNDGFFLGDARLNVRATWRDLYLRVGLDGAIMVYDNDESNDAEFGTSVKDAYMRYTPHRAVSIFAGRFKPPYDIEELTSRETQFFVHRSLESRGVARYEGLSFDKPGFAPGRQLGVMVGSNSIMEMGNMDLGYAFAITNGTSTAINDNEIPALYLRGQLAWNFEDATQNDEEGPATQSLAKGIQVGLSGFWNDKTFGEAPNKVNDRVFGAGFDVSGAVSIFHFRAQVLWNATIHLPFEQACTEHALGAHGQFSVEIPGWGIAPGVRYALYDPRIVNDSNCGPADNPDEDRVQHITGGLRFRPESWPLIVWAEYTRAIEQDGQRTDNDRVEASVQVVF